MVGVLEEKEEDKQLRAKLQVEVNQESARGKKVNVSSVDAAFEVVFGVLLARSHEEAEEEEEEEEEEVFEAWRI